MIIIDPVSFGLTDFKRASKGGYLDVDGIWKEAAADVARLSYQPSDLSAPPYALIEGAATNEVTLPRHFNRDQWGKSRCYVLPCAAIGPDGLMTADKLCEDNTSGFHYMDQRRDGFNETVTLQVIVRPAGRTFIQVGFANWVSQACYGIFDLVQLTATPRLPTSDYIDPKASIEAWPGGWVRCIFTVTKRADTLLNCPQISLLSSGANSNYAADGASGVYIWYAGIEQGDRATTPIPDATAFVSRSSSRTYLAADKTIKVAAANVAAYDVDIVTGLARGLSLEPAANNFILNSDVDGATGAQPTGMATYLNPVAVTTEKAIGPNGKAARHVLASTDTNCGYYNCELFAGSIYTTSVWVYLQSGHTHGVLHVRPEGVAIQSIQSFGDADPLLVDQWQRIHCTFTPAASGSVAHVMRPRTAIVPSMFGEAFFSDAWQCESGPIATSYIQSAAATGYRAADVSNMALSVRAPDVIGDGATLLYSNVPVVEPVYSATATYAKGDLVLAPGKPDVYESLVAANQGGALTDTAKWLKRKEPSNRWRMLDQYNNTQTTNPGQIVLTLSPRLISQGIYLGNLDANEVTFVVQDLQKGIVYQETQNLIVSTSKASFFRWCFNRIRRRSYAVSVKLPVYVNALVTVIIKKPGATAACGMCAVGPLVDVGLAEYGLSAEIKDYSSTTFNFDGTSETVARGYSKRMSVDVQIDDDQVDAVFEALVGFRQKPVVYLGSVLHGLACVFGKFSSFKVIVASKPVSKAALQIEGTV